MLLARGIDHPCTSHTHLQTRTYTALAVAFGTSQTLIPHATRRGKTTKKNFTRQSLPETAFLANHSAAPADYPRRSFRFDFGRRGSVLPAPPHTHKHVIPIPFARSSPPSLGASARRRSRRLFSEARRAAAGGTCGRLGNARACASFSLVRHSAKKNKTREKKKRGLGAFSGQTGHGFL